MARRKAGNFLLGMFVILCFFIWLINAFLALIEPLLHREFLIIIGAVPVVVFLVFVLTHLDRLTEPEVQQLASKRRKKEIRNYFKFKSGPATVNMQFKSQMAPQGTFYTINCNLHDLPSVAAALLKYKKHEWILLAFERSQQVDTIWVNKGSDNQAVGLTLPILRVFEKALQGGYTSVLAFHNHPNSDPYHLNFLAASPTDIDTAKQWATALNQCGITHVAMVCERGRFNEYFLSAADSLLQMPGFVVDIARVNGKSRFGNLWLHLQRTL